MRCFVRWFLIVLLIGLGAGCNAQGSLSTGAVTPTSPLLTILSQCEHEVHQRLAYELITDEYSTHMLSFNFPEMPLNQPKQCRSIIGLVQKERVG